MFYERQLKKEQSYRENQIKQEELIEQLKEEETPAVRIVGRAKRKPFSHLESFLMAVIGLAVFSMLMFNIYASMSASTMNRRVQDMRHEIDETQTSIDNLTQHKYELTQRERLQEVAEKYGLELNDENIIHLRP